MAEVREIFELPAAGDGIDELTSKRLVFNDEKRAMALSNLQTGVLNPEDTAFLRKFYAEDFPANEAEFKTRLPFMEPRKCVNRNAMEAIIFVFALELIHRIEKRGNGCTQEESSHLKDCFMKLGGGYGTYPENLETRLCALEAAAECKKARPTIKVLLDK